MRPSLVIRRDTREVRALLVAIVLLTVAGSMEGRNVRAASQAQTEQKATCFDPLVIQGRITGIQGTVVTVKSPNGYPGGPGGHAQFVVAGPSFTIDISRARILLPDGKQLDRLPLEVGDHALMVLSGPGPTPPAPGGAHNVNHAYAASIVQRIVQGDTFISH